MGGGGVEEEHTLHRASCLKVFQEATPDGNKTVQFREASNRETKHHYHPWDFFREELVRGKRWAPGRGARHEAFTNWIASVGGGQAQVSLGLGHDADS